ncbi:stage II sporulation protein M [Clostridium senegalense]|uniref:stage II sporulation protein M n=1 Tax=Clostridium senegalense TaxID=1465809 RepID=UPI001C127F26|nr:stage II sporulation protein M [Clostridium senegalense]MBU5225289.1 stage II sporulation protein M [Clostridium senegalense]
MSRDIISEKILKNINDNALIYFIATVCICVGIILGICCVKYLTPAENDTMVSYINIILQSVAGEDINSKAIFVQAIKNNGLFILAYGILGITIVGIPVILILNIVKGFTLGFSFSFFISKFANKGALLGIFSVLPQNLIYIPCIVIASVLAIKYSVNLIKLKRNLTNPFTTKEYMKNFIMLTIVIIIGSGIESLINPIIIRFIV